MNWIGLDVGGTRIKGGVLSPEGRVLARHAEATKPGQPLVDFENQLDAIVSAFLGQHEVAGIGVSLTGPTNPEVGCVYLPGKIKYLDQHKTVPYLKDRWKLPVIADNDGRLAALAEWRLGAGKGIENFVLFTLGTGIGSGVVMDGRLLTDRNFQRGTQLGHHVIDINGPLCLTGTYGTGESVASVTALVTSVRDHVARGLPTMLDDNEPAEFPAIVKALRAGDPVMRDIFDRWLDRFAIVILNAFYAYTPDAILLSGGPMKAADLFVPPLSERVNKAAFRIPVGRHIPLEAATLGEDAGWIGAALRIQEHLQQSPS